MSTLSLLVLGNTQRREFREAREILDGLARVTNVPDAPAAHLAAGEYTGGSVVPDVIVVAQAYPGEFSHEAVDGLRRLAPLAPVVGLLGSWCEGETRSGNPWPAAIRVYWHQWGPRCRRELKRMIRGERSAWTLPQTATDEERVLLDAEKAEKGSELFSGRKIGLTPFLIPFLIAICAQSFAVFDWLSAACRLMGCSTVWLRPPHPARVEGAATVLFDLSDGREEEVDRLRHLAASLHPAPVIALLSFPRPEDHRRILAAGAAAVLSKPVSLADLYHAMDEVATRN